MATNFFPLGYHFEEFRSGGYQKKKLISHPVLVTLRGKKVKNEQLGFTVIQVVLIF